VKNGTVCVNAIIIFYSAVWPVSVLTVTGCHILMIGFQYLCASTPLLVLSPFSPPFFFPFPSRFLPPTPLFFSPFLFPFSPLPPPPPPHSSRPPLSLPFLLSLTFPPTFPSISFLPPPSSAFLARSPMTRREPWCAGRYARHDRCTAIRRFAIP